MPSTMSLSDDNLGYSKGSNQSDSLMNCPINRAFITVTQEVAELLRYGYLDQSKGSSPAEIIAIRAIEPEYRQVFMAEPLTERELDILQLIVDGCSNGEVAQTLYISTGTVKSHVCNILKKLCAKDRTQAAIRSLRLGLTH
nr:response regulator transcription factor [Nodosilinea nodulosa]